MPRFPKSESELAEPKSNAKMIIRRLNRNSEPQASIEMDKYTIQYDLLVLSPSPVYPISLR